MRYTGPRNKLARREKIDLELKTAGSKAHSNLLRRINIPPGQHGTKRFRRRTEYGSQLREKQKLKRIYGLTEKQLRGYFIKAERVTGNTADLLVSQLEMRLDNVIYKLGFTPTRPSARQLVNHGHVAVNGKKVTIPSYQVKSGDIITFHKQKTIKIPYITQMIEKKDTIIPDWLERDAAAGKVAGIPSSEGFTAEVDLQSVIEFYSR